MKFGLYLLANQNKDWEEAYLDYRRLKDLIRAVHEKHVMDNEDPDGIGKGTSLSPTKGSATHELLGASGEVTQERFFEVLEGEMKKIEVFTKDTVKSIRNLLLEIDQEIEQMNIKANTVGKDFLKLEKYVNLNFTGFHKILKKHDKWLPNPCKAFYLTRLHDHHWVRGDYSDVIVSMSNIYSNLRGDEKIEEKESAAQNFVRSTRKYWVHTEDVSKVKYQILQHLPVFLQKDETGEVMSVDSQLTNSVYLDNYAMELYHGRLDKTPGAIALRFRWYGTRQPRKVFIERKTHREGWTGDISVKERFMVNEEQVLPLLRGDFNVQEQAQAMRDLGKSDEQVEEWLVLADEICDAIVSKQLLPVMRTQYMRTAFQVPFDATVRISLDTNLSMIVDRTKETANMSAWYRDPSNPVPLNEITRFPHAVLEVKLQLEGEGQTPEWFIHGCAVLLPEEVQGVPYWIDDTRQILRSPKRGANLIYNHLLPHDSEGNSKIALAVLHDRGDSFMLPNECMRCDWAREEDRPAHITQQKVEPKLFLANERTFIKWLHMAVVMSSLSVGVLAFTNATSEAQDYAMLLMPIALLFIIYALSTFLWRMEQIKSRADERWDDPLGPVLLTSMLILALVTQYVLKLRELFINGTY
eukprot:GSChrysophyteH1.ASY1.ANO1.786.1 assembled CDS